MEKEETTEQFRERMRRLMREADERYEKMSPEDQQLLDEAARRHHEKVRFEILASNTVASRKGHIKPLEAVTSAH